ncbi:MAG TPA: 3-oxoacyl-ACP reductase family protein [Candidatus Binataceae bacterium]|nr:3-oxoacyl-ACP reductase family protein [Candidatus Binataceae bacterium]
MELNGKLALVTGGSRGIGRAIALGLAEAGADVAVNFKENKSAADEVVARITNSGRRAIAVGADVSVPDEVSSMMAAITAELGEVSILVNNAGVARGRRIEDVDLALFDETIAVNLRSAFLVTSAVLPAMRQARWGRLIFISSTAANVGGVVGPHYAASKAGMIGLMHSYASNLVKEGITANVISPALVETDMVQSDLRITPDRIPVGRFGRVEEVADVAVMLARNGYITGQSINVNGGVYFTSYSKFILSCT